MNADVTVIISTILKADTYVHAANHINTPSFPHYDQKNVDAPHSSYEYSNMDAKTQSVFQFGGSHI